MSSLDAEPGDGQTWYVLGRCYMQQQKYRKAYDAYQQAVYRDGRNPTFWCSIGVLYYQINQVFLFPSLIHSSFLHSFPLPPLLLSFLLLLLLPLLLLLLLLLLSFFLLLLLLSFSLPPPSLLLLSSSPSPFSPPSLALLFLISLISYLTFLLFIETSFVMLLMRTVAPSDSILIFRRFGTTWEHSTSPVVRFQIHSTPILALQNWIQDTNTFNNDSLSLVKQLNQVGGTGDKEAIPTIDLAGDGPMR